MEICSLSSRSHANCVLIRGEKTNLLIDCGLEFSKLRVLLEQVDVKPEDLNGVLLTHEHMDHMRGVNSLANILGIPVYLTRGTWEVYQDRFGLNFINQNLINIIDYNEFWLNDISVKAFPVPHDCNEPVGFSLIQGNKKIVIATDFGHMTEEIARHMLNASIAMIEANYDTWVLEQSKYPEFLKQRITGNNGHLSNEEAGDSAANLFLCGTKHILFGHLSENNNTPEIAKTKIFAELKKYSVKLEKDMSIAFAPRNSVSEIIAA